jgi:hypothetical protein
MEQVDIGMQLARGNYLDQSAPLHDSFALVISLYGDYYHSLAYAGYTEDVFVKARILSLPQPRAVAFFFNAAQKTKPSCVMECEEFRFELYSPWKPQERKPALL